jgi:uncharacterized protein involved in type VI secretion and phage assembly
MSPAPAPALAAAVEIRVGGQALDPSLAERLLEARVQDNLMLPDAFMLRLRDADFQLVDGSLFDVGATIELRFAAADGGAPGEAFSGEVATIAPEFEAEGCVLSVRGYDLSHTLNRSRRTRTFQDMTASDIAAKIIGEAGLPKAVEPTRDVYPFEQQSNETDWHYLWRLAGRVSYELACVDGKVHFGPPGAAAGAPVKLDWGRDLRAFHPRATGVAQVENVVVSAWDPKAKRRVTANARSARLDSKIGLDRDSVAKGLGGGTTAVPDQIVTSQSEADALAQSTLDRLANGWLEAEGSCRGNPRVRAGSKVQIAGVGTRFGGEYLVTKSTHSIRGEKGYETHFEISGRNRRTLVDLLTPAPPGDRIGQLVVGIVTNTDDPEKMGRVRVKFPWLDERQEGWWARVASPGASGKRGGMTMTPLVDDEVVVGFEQGDPRRPFVLGSLQSGTSRPGADGAGGAGKPDGSFSLHGDKDVSIAAGEDMSIASDGKLDANAAGDVTLQTDGRLAITGKGSEVSITGASGSVVINADGSITIKGGQITIDASAQLTLQSSGTVAVKGSQVMLG